MASCFGTFTPRNELLILVEIESWSRPREREDALEKWKISCSKLKHGVSVVQSVALSLYQLSYLASHLVYKGFKVDCVYPIYCLTDLLNSVEEIFVRYFW